MIIASLQGGLGNQMFQYALGKALSLKHHTELKLDTRSLSKGVPPREYALHMFDITEKFAPKFSYLISKITKTYVNERDLDGSIPNASNNLYLDGYWQSEDYFKAHEKEIRACFKFKETRKHLAPASVSIHVRRTDYVERHGRAKIIGCSLGYYHAAILYMASKVNRPTFYVFSDDLNWSKNNIKFPGFNFHYFSSQDDLRIMSLCKHNIVANSSFSWWGAWLNQNPNKIVVAPDPWFNSTEGWRREIVPHSWIKIKKTL